MTSATADKIKIIVTDDHRLFRTGVMNGLSRFPDIEIIGEAEHGQQLLNLLEYFQPDMIIMGIQMPVMDGLTALPIIKEHYPACKVIILSMHNDPAVIRRMVELGANSYLTKEAGSAEIYETVQALKSRLFYFNRTILKAATRIYAEMNSDLIFSFSKKEVCILRMLREKKLPDQISKAIDLSWRTIEEIISKMQMLTSTKSIRELVAFAEEKKLFD